MRCIGYIILNKCTKPEKLFTLHFSFYYHGSHIFGFHFILSTEKEHIIRNDYKFVSSLSPPQYNKIFSVNMNNTL